MPVIAIVGLIVLLAAFMAGVVVGVMIRHEMNGRPDVFASTVS